MIGCTSDVMILIRVIKVFLSAVKYVMPIILIVYCTFDVFRIIISKNEDDVKKYRKYIYNRVFNCILLFLIPTIIFLLFDILLDDRISNFSDFKNCWQLVE